MTDAAKSLDALLQSAAAAPHLYGPSSRYYGLVTAQLDTADGRKVTYLTRRIVPSPERFSLLREHVVSQGDRPDLLAATHFGDPEAYWRLCDANGATRPREITDTLGRRLRITLPEGLPGATGRL